MRNLTVLAGVGLALLSACGGGGYGTSNNPPPVTGGTPQLPSGTPAAAASVQVVDNAFEPNSVLIRPGGTVTWTWVGNGHSVTAYGAPALPANAPVRNAGFVLGPLTFNDTGDYQYICTVHGTSSYGSPGGMAGVVYVR